MRSRKAYVRAYKACYPCRKRKTRCNLDAENGPPCQRCRHEMRECVIPEKRAWDKPSSQSMDDDGFVETNHSKRRRTEGEPEQQAEQERIESDHETLSSHDSDLVHSVVQTVVTSGKDALGLLFQAAESTEHQENQSQPAQPGPLHQDSGADHALPGQCPAMYHRPVSLSTISDTADRTWSASRFVKMGWLTPAEAVTYLDLFFKDMAALSPVDLSSYSGADGHFDLVTREPLLCCTMLAISSRYHTLPGAAGISRGYFIHERFWRHCQHLVMRLMFGQEKGSTAKTRTLGSIEGLILMSEWNPRALHFPPETDGWDSDLLLTPSAVSSPSPRRTSTNCLVEVIEPARRSDRMSWMLLGAALSLAHELDVFEDDDDEFNAHSAEIFTTSRLRQLLYISINQLAARQGSTSLLPSQPPLLTSKSHQKHLQTPSHEAFLEAWAELIKLFKSFSDIAFSTKSATRRLLRSGRYASILDHFRPLLTTWGKEQLQSPRIATHMQDHLFIEYCNAQIHVCSLGMQAECEQVFKSNRIPSTAVMDHEHTQQVIQHSSALLQRVVQLAEKGVLRFAPVRVFIRATTGSIFLLKALALGVRSGQMKSALSILDNTVTALRSSAPDDTHLAHIYADLLKTHVLRLKSCLESGSSKKEQRKSSNKPTPKAGPESSRQANTVGPPQDDALQSFIDLGGITADPLPHDDPSPSGFSDWFALPFDPAMAPLFPVGGDSAQTSSTFGGDNLEFLWNFQAL